MEETSSTPSSAASAGASGGDASSKGVPPVPGVKVALRPLGSAPMIPKSKIRVKRSDAFSVCIRYVQRCLAVPGEPEPVVYLFLDNSFSPAPTQSIEDLFMSFGTGDIVNGELHIQYSLQPAYG